MSRFVTAHFGARAVKVQQPIESATRECSVFHLFWVIEIS